jgi:hypothetical protein
MLAKFTVDLTVSASSTHHYSTSQVASANAESSWLTYDNAPPPAHFLD